MTALSGRILLVAGLALAAMAAVPGSAMADTPFSGSVNLNANQSVVFGPGGPSPVAITSITFTNFSTYAQQVTVFNPVSQGSCSGTAIGGSSPRTVVLVQPRTTLQLTYPTGLVFPVINGVSCIAAQVNTSLAGGSVEVLVAGTH